jgi:hypothetical protein
MSGMVRIAVGAACVAALILASAFSTSAAGSLSRWSLSEAWSVPVTGVQMVAEIARRGEGPVRIAAQGTDRVVVVDAAGAVLATRDLSGGPINAAMGDVNGDGTEDVILAQGSAATTVTAMDAALKTLWSWPVAGLGAATRVLGADLDGDGRGEIVIGDAAGKVVALTPGGRPLWSYAFPALPQNAEVRGLDDLALPGGRGRLVAVARRAGAIVLLDAKGKVVASHEVRNPVRRLRVFDADGDGQDDAVVGDETGAYQIVRRDGQPRPLGSLGETLTEIRTLEADGDVSHREYILGGKRGAFRVASGAKIQASGSVAGKVSAAGGVDCSGDGRDELFLGTEEGGLFMLDGTGAPMAAIASLGKVERIFGVESTLRDRLVVVAAGSALKAFRGTRDRPPAWYVPWTPALAGLIAVVAGALALARAQPKPAPPAPAADARTLQTDVAAAKVRDWMARGKVAPDLGAERLRQLEKQRAKVLRRP